MSKKYIQKNIFNLLAEILLITSWVFLTVTSCFGQTIIYTSGTTNWTVPACVFSVQVQAWGGGGGGGGSTSNQNSAGDEACTGGGGGGGGGFVTRTYTVVPGQVYTIVVGAGGTAGPGVATNLAYSAANVITGSTANNGGNGGNSTFSGPATVATGILTAFGGGRGGGAWQRNQTNGFSSHMGTDGVAGIGGSGANGTATFIGGNGSSGRHSGGCFDQSGGGGGGAGTSANGLNANVLTGCPPGNQNGGTGGAILGGNGANGRVMNSYISRQILTGNPGNVIGAGGSGCMIHLNSWPNTWTTGVGGAGARGEVRLTFTSCLPIELNAFIGSNETRFNELNWSTVSEINNDYFTLERSIDGTEWQKTIEVDGGGTSVSLLNYQYNDYDFSPNMINYYRLSQTDFDGTIKNTGDIVAIDNRINLKVIVRRINILGQEVSEDQKGIVIYLYEDGNMERVYVD